MPTGIGIESKLIELNWEASCVKNIVCNQIFNPFYTFWLIYWEDIIAKFLNCYCS